MNGCLESFPNKHVVNALHIFLVQRRRLSAYGGHFRAAPASLSYLGLALSLIDLRSLCRLEKVHGCTQMFTCVFYLQAGIDLRNS